MMSEYEVENIKIQTLTKSLRQLSWSHIVQDFFRTVDPLTGKSSLPTVDNTRDETISRLVCAERKEERPGRWATWTSWLSMSVQISLGLCIWALPPSTALSPGNEASRDWYSASVMCDPRMKVVDKPGCRIHNRRYRYRPEDQPGRHFHSPVSTVPKTHQSLWKSFENFFSN